jgi:hypothetical protein
MLIIIIVLSLLCTFAVLGNAVLVGAVVINSARALEQVINARTDEILDAVDESLIQHQATRNYLVEVLEKKLLPHVGFREPQRTETEQVILQHAADMLSKQ